METPFAPSCAYWVLLRGLFLTSVASVASVVSVFSYLFILLQRRKARNRQAIRTQFRGEG